MIKIDNLKLNKNNKDILEKYQIYLLTVKQKEEKTTVSSYIEDIYKYLDNNNYKTSSIIRKIVSIKLFHKYLSEEYKIKDVSSKIINPRLRRKLPNILTIEEVDNLLDIKLNTPFDYRNKAMLELMYSSGLRVSELVDLKLNNIDLDNGYVICLGKGKKERIIPI